MYSKRSIGPIEGTVIGTITISQSGPGSNVNEWVFHTGRMSRISASL